MAWTPVYQQLRDHRKIRELYRLLNVSRAEAIGTLVLIWTWAIDNCTQDGELLSVTVEDIANAAYWGKKPKLLFEALIQSKWIDVVGDKIFLHDWEDYNRPFYQYVERKNKDKLRKRQEKSAGNSTEIPQEAPEEFRDSHPHSYSSSYSSKDIKTSSSDKPPKVQVPYDEIIAFYNKNRRDMPEAKGLTELRKGLINARYSKYGLNKIQEAILKAKESDFINGGGPKAWRADFNWIMKPENFIKVLEGTYDNRLHKASQSKVAQSGNFQQREYSDDDLDALMANKEAEA